MDMLILCIKHHSSLFFVCFLNTSYTRISPSISHFSPSIEVLLNGNSAGNALNFEDLYIFSPFFFTFRILSIISALNSIFYFEKMQ